MRIQKYLAAAVVTTGLVLGAATLASAHGPGNSQGWGLSLIHISEPTRPY